ncbi:Cell division protein FtsW [Prochlorococcus marinus str. MIT 9515]|uniref:Probable peptidoglycan glycosyltransferase FtsW n=1 Tax=Prochlorococcus marinus (strain MIT 9515) TaxID=167542 RepID=A2BYI3_PROM5|nr:FtsW/RodA/SpoVE family cell cycle protein [Prochlorococcus marinus]ABM72844.1 Cell division protein FtsW [Prochlorococcus marinus str. MIT 9515]
MEISKAAKKYSHSFERNRTFDSRIKPNYLRNNFLPLPWEIWPYEGKILLILICIWSIFGLFILGSASWWVASKEMGDWAYYLKRQIIWCIPGLTIFYFVLNTNIRDLLKTSKIIFYFLIILIISTIFFGSTVNGSSRWLIMGPLQIQPSELIKPFAILEAANLFAHWNLIKKNKKLISLSTFGLLILLIMKQPNLSTAGLTGILFWVMGLCGGVKYSSLFSVASLGFLSGCISILSNEYQKLRVISFIDPWKDSEGNGYQLIQSLLAIGSGGLFGQGFGLSTQKLQYLPIQSTDFIFAIFAEEFGLLGSTLLLGFLVLLSYVSLRIAIKCRNNYTKLVAIGCVTLLIGQSILHIAVATGMMPTTGLPLPFVSYGGNSLLSSFFVIGMLLRCSLESTGFIGIISARKSLN